MYDQLLFCEMKRDTMHDSGLIERLLCFSCKMRNESSSDVLCAFRCACLAQLLFQGELVVCVTLSISSTFYQGITPRVMSN